MFIQPNPTEVPGKPSGIITHGIQDFGNCVQRLERKRVRRGECDLHSSDDSTQRFRRDDDGIYQREVPDNWSEVYRAWQVASIALHVGDRAQDGNLTLDALIHQPRKQAAVSGTEELMNHALLHVTRSGTSALV